ncbi:hypothetical protein AVEN_246358-1 [Araneus ventricosus]|uniref:Uncharacterized protein n=1 Tax=Araneus ventricosus TaxID=182803 RepID=A0A4Y2UAY1_ARAVE|nr:hypothetical protein AVEN_246358-1 [Araneus ventricosus]
MEPNKGRQPPALAKWCASTLEESEFLNNAIPNRWIGRAGTNDKVTSPWPLQVTVHYTMRRSCGDLRKTKWMCHNCHATSKTSETRIADNYTTHIRDTWACSRQLLSAGGSTGYAWRHLLALGQSHSDISFWNGRVTG